MVPVVGRGVGAARVLEEARVIAQIDHPSIVPLYGVEVHAGHLCLIEELVEGKTLDAVLKERGRLPVGEAVRIATGVARELGVKNADKLPFLEVLRAIRDWV